MVDRLTINQHINSLDSRSVILNDNLNVLECIIFISIRMLAIPDLPIISFRTIRRRKNNLECWSFRLKHHKSISVFCMLVTGSILNIRRILATFVQFIIRRNNNITLKNLRIKCKLTCIHTCTFFSQSRFYRFAIGICIANVHMV